MRLRRRPLELVQLRLTRLALAATVVAMLSPSTLIAQRDARPTIPFIEVERGVKLEVLDWGYSADRLGDDVLAVIDTLGLVRPVLAGHSLAGEELSSIGSRHPEKVAGLVYLDAAYGYAFYSPGNFETDGNEVRRGLERLHVAAANGNVDEVRRQLARLLETDLPALERSLRSVERATPAASTNPPTRLMPPLAAGIARLLDEGTQRYTEVHVPVLAIYAAKGISPAIAADSAAAAAWLAERAPASRVVRTAAPNARVVILGDATHDVFRSNEAEVLQEMHSFISGLPR